MLKLHLYLSLILICCLIPVSADTRLNSNQLESDIEEYSYKVVNVYPHDPLAFTQGLLYKDGYLYESTGLYGRSSLRKVELESGKVIQKYLVADEVFAEGLATNGNQLVQLTWKAGKGFIYNADLFLFESSFDYPGEGWGLTFNNNQFIKSDGTSSLHFLDAVDMKVSGKLQVTRSGLPVKYLNELEMVRGKIFANVWQSDYILIIAPQSGAVVGKINLAGLLQKYAPDSKANVLNGIAYDAEGDRLFVTGKLWPKLFEIELTPLNPD